MILQVDTGEALKYTRKLEQMTRSAFPVAVRQTLDSTAFDVKTHTMPAEFTTTFEKRKPNFSKANSKVVKASGFDISRMQSTVGFLPLGGTNKAVDDLEQQEHGGSIGGRAFIPLKQARTGGSWQKNVRLQNRISQIKNMVNADDNTAESREEQYVRSAIHAGAGGYLIGNYENNGNRTVYRIRSVVKKGKATEVKSVPMFSLQTGREVRPKATHFMRNASTTSAAKMNEYYIKAAKRQIDKLK